MTLDFSIRRTGATIAGTAVLFAALYWLLDTGSMLLASGGGVASAIVPEGGQFLNRVLYAAVFAAAGAVAGAALQRSRDIQILARSKLAESERKYQALLASSFDSVLTLGPAGRIVDASDSAAALFGQHRATLAGTPISSLLEAEDGDLLSLLGSAARSVDDSLRVRARGERGRTFPAEIRVVPMPGGDESAQLLAIRETTTDIVAQKALRHSERRYQALFDNIPVGVYRSQPDGRLLAANPALVRMLGYGSVDELLAEGNTRDMYCDPQQAVRLRQLLEQHGKARNVEICVRRRNGGEVAVLANVRAIASDNNEDVVYEGTLSDISDLLAAREALEDSEEHFRALCEHAPDVINVINADGEVIYSSPSSRQLSGRSPEEQVGLKLFRSVHPDDVAAVTEIVAEGFAKPGAAQRFTCRVYRQDGELRHVDAVGTAFLTRRGELRAVIHSRDVTERMQTETQLREMQKIQVVGRMSDGLVHEFNNLLTVISGNLELLDDRIQERVLKPHLESALHACQQGSDLTRRLMAFADRHGATLEDINVNGLLMDMEPILRRSLSETIRIGTEYGDDLWEVRVDPVQLEAALLQLAVNAKEAMPEGGTLTLVTRNHWAGEDTAVGAGRPPEGDCVCICLSDSGRGMDADVLARATEPFFSTRNADGRTGLGLSAVKRFVEAAGGTLTITSEPGAGTDVRLYLPRITTSDYVVEGIAEATGGSERLLVVDDNPDVRRATAALLRSMGYEVREASDGNVALQLLREEKFDLLFTDLAMPRISGLELAEQARAENPALRILLTSGNDAAMTEANDGLTSTYELIRKPFRKRLLAEQVRQALDV